MPNQTCDSKASCDQAEKIGLRVASRVLDKLRLDPKKGNRSKVWNIPRQLLERGVYLHCVRGMDCSKVYAELEASIDEPMVPATNFRRFMKHAREMYEQVSYKSFNRVMADPDYVPGDGNVDVMAETLAVNLYERALHLLGGGDDGEPPTEAEMRIINRALDTLASISAGSATAKRKLAQARLDQMKADKMRKALADTLDKAPQNQFSADQIMRFVDGVLAGGVAVEDAIKAKGGVS